MKKWFIYHGVTLLLRCALPALCVSLIAGSLLFGCMAAPVGDSNGTSGAPGNGTSGASGASDASDALGSGTSGANGDSDSISGDVFGSVMNIAALADKKLDEPPRIGTGIEDSDAETAASGVNDFAFNLSSGLVKDITDENFVCSPYSIWLPLAALVNTTADDGARESLLTALGAAGIESDGINRAASRMLFHLTRQRENQNADARGEQYHTPIKIANAIFLNKGLTLRNEFANVFTEYYRGIVANVDFGSNDAAAAVNNWASENTDRQITSIVEKFDPKTVAAIANAIYYYDRWLWEFDATQTKEGTFHSPVGDMPAYYMTRPGDGQLYYEDDRIQAVSLEYNHGGSMYILLPKSGDAVELLSSMTADYFADIRRSLERESGMLSLPRFRIESDIEMTLKETLISMGVPLFNEATAQLTGGLIEESIPVSLSGASHKAVIEIDEKGTTAAAVTVMAMTGAPTPKQTEPFSMVCDRPFVFVLCENAYREFSSGMDSGAQVLFTGIVNQPIAHD